LHKALDGMAVLTLSGFLDKAEQKHIIKVRGDKHLSKTLYVFENDAERRKNPSVFQTNL